MILRTEDGGDTWTQYLDTLDYDFTDICFINEKKGWITGRKITDSLGIGVILYTADSGETWKTQVRIVSDQLFGGLTLFTQVEMLNDSVGWVLGGSYSDNFSSTDVYKTDNGGINWKQIGRILFTPVDKLKIASYDTLWVSPGFYISTDGGINWESRGPNNSTIWRIAPKNGFVGWGFLKNNVSHQRGIYLTLDGGLTWEEELTLNSSTFITEITRFIGNYFWIVGTDGLIMRKSKKLTVVELPKLLSDRINLKQNYPNPFNPTTVIEYYLPKKSNVKLSVYDVLGREIKMLLNNKIQARGTYSIKFDANGMQSGIYFYKIESTGFEAIKKMLLLK